MKIKVSKGKVLLAEPYMMDATFGRGVILMCEHNKEGSLGFVLNKEMEVRVDELVEDFPKFNSPVFAGGPVEMDTLHYLHDVGDLLEGSMQVTKGIYWGGDFEKLKFLIDSGLIQPHNIRFFMGYSGWSPGQLLEELEVGSWVVANMHPNYLFKSKPAHLWKQIMHNKGNIFSVIATMPEEIVVN